MNASPQMLSSPKSPKWRFATRALGVSLAASLAASGCLSDRYRISDKELARQVQLPPQQRGQNMHVVQSIGTRAAPAATPSSPAQAYGAPAGGYAPGYGPEPQVGVYVGVNVGPSYYGPGPGYAAPAPRGGGSAASAARGGGGAGSGFRAPPSGAAPAPAAGGVRAAPSGAASAAGGGAATAAPVGGGGAAAPAGGGGAAAPAQSASGYRSSGGGGSSAPKTNSTKDAEALAILAVVLAATAVIWAAGTEGARYDGHINTTPYQNIYLKDRNGTERVQALGDLTPRDLIGVSRAELSDAEGYGIQRLGRAPLNREGFAFKLDVGSLATRIDNGSVSGAGANIQFGYFFNKKLGLLATTTLTGGEDRLGRGYLRSQFGGELQGFLPGLGPLHLGGFGQGAFAATEIDGAGSSSGNVLAAGGIAELELTTRLTLMFRVGWAWSNIAGQGWKDEGLGISGGLAIY